MSENIIFLKNNNKLKKYFTNKNKLLAKPLCQIVTRLNSTIHKR